MRLKKIAGLEKQIAKLKKLSFTVGRRHGADRTKHGREAARKMMGMAAGS